MKRLFPFICAVSLLIIPGAIKAIDLANRPITGSKHNLASWGPGDIKAQSESRVCIFCHTVHGASGTPLWGHKLSTATYLTYSSATLKSPRNQPDGGSKLCLSCHDGTVAVGGTVKGNLEFEILLTDSGTGKLTAAPGRKLTSDPAYRSTAYYGTDLLNPWSHISHPISLEVNTELIDATAGNDWYLKGPIIDCGSFTTLGTECVYPLKPTNNIYSEASTRTYVGIQCTTCHDAHNNQHGMFMREKVSFDNFSCGHNPFGGTEGFCGHCHQAKPSADLYGGTRYKTGNTYQE